MIYYRCSDKECSAKLHFYPKELKVVRRGEHLPPQDHKTPNTSRAISIQDLLQKPTKSQAGRSEPAPVVSQEPIAQAPNVDNALPKKRTREVTLLNRPKSIIRFHVESLQAGQQFCKSVIDLAIVNSALYLREVTQFSSNDGRLLETPCKALVELEFFAENKAEIVALINSRFEQAPQLMHFELS